MEHRTLPSLPYAFDKLSLLVGALLLLLAGSSIRGAEGQLVRGAGGEVGVAGYNEWGSGYNMVADQIRYTFKFLLNPYDGIAAYERDELDFLAVDAPIAPDPRFLQLPLLGGSIAMTYALFSIPPGTSLNFSREAIARIWLGEITSWNDPILVALNPNVTLPDRPILLTWLPYLGITKWFVHALASFMEDIAPEVAAGLRANETLMYLPPVMEGTRVFACPATQLCFSNLGVEGTLMYLVNDGFFTAGLTSIAKIYNRANRLVGPTSDTIQSAMADYRPQSDNPSELTTYIVDGPGANSYPLSILSILVLRKNFTATTCDGNRLHLSQTLWGLTNRQIGLVVATKGYASMITSWSSKVINLIATMTCNGKRLLSDTLLTGAGPSAPFFSSLGFFYAESQASVTSQYLAGGGLPDLLRGDVDYAGLMNVETSAATTYPQMAWMPVATVPISVGYNLPELRAQNKTLRLNLDILARIYMGDITQWNHNDIAALNEGISLPSAPILVILDSTRSVNYPLSLAFSKANSNFANAVGYGANVTFPISNTMTPDPNDVGLEVNLNYYSMACVPIWTFVGYAAALRTTEQDITQSSIGFNNITQAYLINKDGFDVLPDTTTATAAADAALSTMKSASSSSTTSLTKRQAPTGSGLIADLTDAAGPDSWPITTYFYYVVERDSSSTDCERAKQLSSLVYWAISTDQAAKLLLIDSVASPSRESYGRVLDALAAITCDGNNVFALSGCVYQGTLCSDAGTCSSNGICQCYSGREGQYCEKTTSSGLDDGAIAGIVVGVVVPVLLLLLLLIIGIAIMVKLLRRQKNEDWVIDPNELEWGEVIGAGGFGEVRKAVWRGTEVAVKTINSGYSNDMRNAFIEEVRVMTALRHPNVVLFMAAATKPPHLCIVMEWMTLGSLHDVLHNELIAVLPPQLRLKILRQAAKGMYFLHSSGIVHRDLKSLNLLLDTKWNVKVSDFGLTRFKETMKKGDPLNNLAAGGSVHWTAPEVLNEASDIDYTAADMYSFGIILWEVYTRADPYAGMGPASIAVAVLRDGLRPDIPEDMPTDYRTLMCEAWSTDPAVRPKFLEMMTRLDNMVEASSHSLTGHSWTSSSTAAGHHSIVGSHRYSDDGDSTDGSHTPRGVAATLPAVRVPSGEMAIVFTDIVRALALWEFNASAMRDATMAHNDLLRALLVPHDGYEVSISKDGTSGEGSMCVVFQDVEKAIRWCIQAQAELLKIEWPVELLTHPAAAEEWGDVDDRVIFRGPRVRMGIHLGEPRKIVDQVTRRAEFVGPSVNTAARITTLAEGGQVLFSEKVLEKFKETELAQERNRYAALGKCELPDSPQGAKVYELRIPGLEGRFFGGRARKDKQTQPDEDADSDMSDDEDNVIGMNEDRNEEDSFLTSANLCRWIVDYKDIQLGKQIGTGTYGMVFRGKWKGIDVAVKRFIKQKLTEKRLLEFRAEMAFLSELNHPNVVLFIGACVKRPNLCIVTEFVHSGSLREVLSDRSVKIPFARRLAMLRSAAMGVNYLHTLAKPVIHRDLKSSNLLVDENMNVKIADFGFARLKEENATMTRCGTPCWTAPEVIRGERYSEKADVYSFGIVMWEMLTRKVPYANRNFMGVSMDVLEGKRPPVPHDCPEAFHKLMTRCWHAKPDKRPAISEVIDALSQLVGEDSLLRP